MTQGAVQNKCRPHNQMDYHELVIAAQHKHRQCLDWLENVVPKPIATNKVNFYVPLGIREDYQRGHSKPWRRERLLIKKK